MTKDIAVYFLEDVWNRGAVLSYSNSSSSFKMGFLQMNALTTPLLRLMQYDDVKGRAIRTALDGLKDCNETGLIDRAPFQDWGAGRYEEIFKGITKMPYFYGAVRGVSDTASIILGEESPCGVILRKLDDFAKEKGVSKN